MDRPRLGAHMSIAGAPANALALGQTIGCDAIQMFTRNANRWSARDLKPAEIGDFTQARAVSGIDPVVAHSSYLINLGSPDEVLWNKSLSALIDELKRCQQLGISDYVLHPGAHTSSGEEAGLAQIARGLNGALEATGDSSVMVLLETTAGQGSVLGRTFEQLAWIIAHVQPEARLGVCFDTCHALVAGYEYRTPETYAALWQKFDAVIGLRRLRAIHMNDSLKDLGSHVDRHEQIGKGYVGIETFRMLINDPCLRRVPMILETPKSDDMHEDIENLALLRSLFAGTEDCE
jgi:deoxyribonuclease IV